MALSEVVNKVLKELLDGAYEGPQVDFDLICQRLNVTLFMAKFKDSDVNGMVKRADGGFEVYIRKEHPKNRQRFTLAHEIGHIVSYQAHSFSFDKLSCPDGYIERRTQLRKDPAEVEANEIAGNILMPEEFLESLISKLKNPNLRNLAEEFGVSVAAMSVRLNKLGYYSNEFSTDCF